MAIARKQAPPKKKRKKQVSTIFVRLREMKEKVRLVQ